MTTLILLHGDREQVNSDGKIDGEKLVRGRGSLSSRTLKPKHAAGATVLCCRLGQSHLLEWFGQSLHPQPMKVTHKALLCVGLSPLFDTS